MIRKVTRELLAEYAAIIEPARSMASDERVELADWEQRNLDGKNRATTDWSGWAKSLTHPLALESAPTRTAKQAIPAELRWDIWKRDDFTCQCCGARRFLTVDHILAEARGGTLDPANLQTLCRTCNSRKGTR